MWSNEQIGRCRNNQVLRSLNQTRYVTQFCSSFISSIRNLSMRNAITFRADETSDLVICIRKPNSTSIFHEKSALVWRGNSIFSDNIINERNFINDDAVFHSNTQHRFNNTGHPVTWICYSRFGYCMPLTCEVKSRHIATEKTLMLPTRLYYTIRSDWDEGMRWYYCDLVHYLNLHYHAFLLWNL